MRSVFIVAGMALIIVLGYFNIFGLRSLYSIVESYFEPIDNKYIMNQSEWVGDKGGLLRFDDQSETIKGDTIYRDHKPIIVVRRLNKYFNEMQVYRLNDKTNDTYTSTEEITN